MININNYNKSTTRYITTTITKKQKIEANVKDKVKAKQQNDAGDIRKIQKKL